MEKQRPLVLVTNDDGIASPGLKAAARGVLKYADVIVAAPCRQQTGMGRAFPRTEDLGIIEEVPYEVDHFQVPAYAIHGSPAYAAAYGILELSPRKPDLCVSGINYGENLGMTLTCSGTLGAAFEASSQKVPAVAVSVQADLSIQRSEDFQEYDWTVPQAVVEKWAGWALKNLGRDGMDVLNINIPAGIQDAEKYRITTQSRQNYFEFCAPGDRDRTKPYELQARKCVNEELLERDSDIYAVYKERIISVTALSTVMSLPVDKVKI